MTATVRYTPQRHRLLAEVAAGRMKVYVALQWNLLRGDVFLSGPEVRVADSIRPLVRASRDRRGWSVRALLTDEGESVLASWSARRGEPLIQEMS